MEFFDKFEKQEKTFQPSANIHTSRIPFAAYHGNEQYIFISYAHLDADAVYNGIKKFHDVGYNVWYDEGIAPGNEWTDEIADALEKCALFIVFITPQSVISQNVQNEINFAIDEQKPFLAIHLEKTVLRSGLKLQIGTKQAILKYLMSEDEYNYKYTTAFTRHGITAASANKSQLKDKPASAQTTALQQDKQPILTHTPQSADLQYEIFKIGYESDVPQRVFDHAFEWIDTKTGRYHGAYKSIIIPEKATELGHGTFYCSGVGKIIVPKTVSIIHSNAFVACEDLTLVEIHNPNAEIGNPICLNCPKLSIRCHKNSAVHKELTSAFSGEISFFPDNEKSNG